MSKYILTFEKSGYIRYTSHLDMVRLFQRAIRRSGIILAYSQGFNPHPKMSFSVPCETPLPPYSILRKQSKADVSEKGSQE